MNKYYPTIAIDQAVYKRWLQRKTQSLVRRDRKYLQSQGKDPKIVIFKEYKTAIHDAVCECQGKDAYTGEALHWNLLSEYDNEKAKADKREYKKILHYCLSLTMLMN